MMINVDLLDRLKNGEDANEILDSFKDQLMNAEMEYNRQKEEETKAAAKKREDEAADKACETFAVTLTEATIAFLQTLVPDLVVSPEEKKALIEDGRKTAREILAGVKMANLLADIIKPIAPKKETGAFKAFTNEDKDKADPIADFLRDMGL
jgi:hypothetical protein